MDSYCNCRNHKLVSHTHVKKTTEDETMQKANLNDKLALFSDYWAPKIVGDLNDSYIKLAKLKGEFVWHKHDDEDELFFVVKGNLVIKLRDQDINLTAGEFVVIPKGVEHLPIAEEEVHVMLIEPKTVLNTGDATSELTQAKLDSI